MQLYHSNGQRTEALRLFKGYKEMLRSELGIDPMIETQTFEGDQGTLDLQPQLCGPLQHACPVEATHWGRLTIVHSAVPRLV